MPKRGRNKLRKQLQSNDSTCSKEPTKIRTKSKVSKCLKEHEAVIISKVFSTPMLLEIIMRCVYETRQLLQCRLVSQEFQEAATKCLRNFIIIGFQDFVHRRHRKGRSLENLCKLLTTSKRHNTQFPCTQFHFAGKYKPSRVRSTPNIFGHKWLGTFLALFGFQIQHLVLVFSHEKKNHPINEAFVMDNCLRVIEQTPNLTFLSITLDSKICWEDSTRGSYWPLRTCDKEFERIHLKRSTLPLLPKLRALESIGKTSPKILEAVICESPGLESLILINESQQWSYIEPLNRLDLLRCLVFVPDLNRIDLLENIVQGVKTQMVPIREFNLDLLGLSDADFTNALHLQRVGNAVSQILLQCSESIKIFTWNGVTYIKGMKFPNIMSNVSKITLMRPLLSKEQTIPTTIFRPYTIFCDFPKLVLVRFNTFQPGDLELLANTLSKQCKLKVKLCVISDYKGFCVNDEHLNFIYKYFPYSKPLEELKQSYEFN